MATNAAAVGATVQVEEVASSTWIVLFTKALLILDFFVSAFT
jgi:hypothetical protein